MVKRKVAELEGAALDWAVAYLVNGWVVSEANKETAAGYSPSNIWSQGGPLIERYCIMTYPSILHESGEVTHWAAVDERRIYRRGWVGLTPLIAALRAIVASELGEEVEIPEELA